MAKSAQTVADKWANRTGNAGQDYAQGIRDCTVNPMELAAQAKDKWVAKIMEAASAGRFEDGLRKKTKEQWKDAAIKKGASRLPEGVAQAKPRVIQFLQGFLPAQEVVTQGVRAMPSTTKSDRKARMNAQFDGVSDLKGKF